MSRKFGHAPNAGDSYFLVIITSSLEIAAKASFHLSKLVYDLRAKATMSEFQSEDPFSTALTETERLLVVWDDLTIAGVGDSPIAAFVRKSIADLSLPRMHADSIISFQQLARLLGILDSMRSRGTAEASNTACLVIFIAEEIVRMRNAHSVSGFDGTPKSTLQRFKDLEHWVALRTMVENKQLSRFFERRLMNIISFDVNALPIQLNASPDSLRVIEVGAKLLKTLPLQHNAKILQIIDPQMKALTASNDKCKAYHSRTSGAGDDGVVRAVAHTSEKLAAVKDAHVKVTIDLEDKIPALVEQNIQHKEANCELDQDKYVLTQNRIGIEERVHSLTTELIDIQSQDTRLHEEIFGLQSEITELKSENARMEGKFRLSKSKNQNRIRKLKDEVAIWRKALLDQEYAHDTDDRIYDESFQSRAEKLTEELAEAIDDEAALARDYEQLAVEKLRAEESLVELEDSKAAMLDEIHELVTKNDRLEQELKDASDSLEEAEDDRATLVRNVDKLNSERARLEGALTDAQEILHRISSFSYSIRPTATEPSSGDCDANAKANAYADTETETWSVGVLTLASSVQVTPR
ncbi:MAG: hypothetical protein ALECFALPRED_002349 [Alectoria fallacina]|uniref:Uncharacterized protein n=1 Tax=Alectoria fallacina TaxID=1903189 RepID=A0A8H3FLN9_9LECA|nr:MAG: hypothetical protein ALECFALPRED_002349 [Alectoria fallacina]